MLMFIDCLTSVCRFSIYELQIFFLNHLPHEKTTLPYLIRLQDVLVPVIFHSIYQCLLFCKGIFKIQVNM